MTASPRPSLNVRPTLETLEDRVVPSGSPPVVIISGPPQVGESPYGTYTLGLTAVDPEGDAVTQWTIDWGDGVVQNLPGNPSTAIHTYASGPAVRTITASAVVGGETFAAQVSGAGASLGTFTQAGGGQVLTALMTFGRDVTGMVWATSTSGVPTRATSPSTTGSPEPTSAP